MADNESGTTSPITTEPPGSCADCAVPPETSGDWLHGVYQVSLFPLIGLAIGLVLAYAIRNHVANIERGPLALAGAIFFSCLCVAGAVLDAATVALWAGSVLVPVGLIVSMNRIDATALPAVADRPVVWAGGITLLLLGDISLGLGDTTTFVLSIGALVTLQYPLGIAIGRVQTDGLTIVLLAMAVAAVALVSTFVPLGDSLATFFPLALIVFVILTLLIGSPLLALGEQRAEMIE